jgi:hypothetical protein
MSRGRSETDVPNFYSLSNTFLVALSTADSNKWVVLTKGRWEKRSSKDVISSEYELRGPLRQRQRRMTESEAKNLELRVSAGCDRRE